MAKKIGLVLGSGGARGLAHLGVIKVLQENDVPIDMVAGSSIGSIIGAYYALNLDISELYDVALKTRKRDLIKLIDFSPPNKAIIKGKKIEKFIHQFIGDAEFSDTKIPLYINATDMAKGREVVFDEGKIMDAIRASISIPGIFPPAKIGDRYYIDGGVINPTAANILLEKGADVIIAIDLTIEKEIKLDKLNLINTLTRAFEILRTRISELSMHLEEFKDKIILITPVSSTIMDTYRFYEKSFISDGEKAARKALPTIMEKINSL